MTPDSDPYRTLGLSRGATLDEVKRAYRKLAKANHPDAAGEAALSRFLAIQAAYDQIAGNGSAATDGSRTNAPRRPWEADRDRSDATRRAYGGRGRRGRGRGSAGPPPPPGAGAAGAGAAGTGPAGTGAADKGGEPRPGPDDGDGAGPDRPTNKATFGSTSYDGADAEPFEPDWGGASWYGTTSGTYWTLNPKEYADPRKHGPEYQARARRRMADEADPPPAAPSESPSAGSSGAPPVHTTSSWWASTADPTAAHVDPADPGAAAPTGTTAAAAGTAGAFQTPDARVPGDTARASGNAWDDDATTSELDSIGATFRAWIEDDRPGVVGRVGRAVLGWAPIALGIGWLTGEMSGCARFAASCDSGAMPVAWLAQVLVLAVFLVVPRLARIAVVGTIAALVAAIPGTALLSATTGQAAAEAGQTVLGGLLVVAWVAGIAVGVWRTVGELRAARSAGPRDPPGTAHP